ncbi:MAG: hypothetical protein AAF597_06310, partial [Bacteroidota bacterium]
KGWAAEELWEERGYPIWQPYQDGYAIKTVDGHWNFTDQNGAPVRIASPQEYRHTMSTVLNGLLGRGLEIMSYQEETGNDFAAAPGTWEHYTSCLPPWIYLLCRKQDAQFF